MDVPAPAIRLALKSLLRRAGLEDRAADIYLALLSLKHARVSQIARTAKQPRALTYYLVKQLEALGLVSRIEEGKVQTFAAEPPERLIGMVEERSRDNAEVATLLRTALPSFHAMERPFVGKPRVSMLRGDDGMREVYREALSFDILGCGNAKTMWDHYGMSAPQYAYGRKFKELSMRGKDLFVDNEEARWFIRDNPPHEHYEIKLLPKGATFITDSLIYGDTIALFAYDEDLTIVRIENRNIADYFRAWHGMLWERAGK